MIDRISRSQVFWSEEDQAFIALCSELPHLSAFGDTPAEAVMQLEEARQLAIEVYRESGWNMPGPQTLSEFSGQFRIRLPKSLHAQLAQRAHAEGVSQNTLATTYITRGLSLSMAEEAYVGLHNQFRDGPGAQARGANKRNFVLFQPKAITINVPSTWIVRFRRVST